MWGPMKQKLFLFAVCLLATAVAGISGEVKLAGSTTTFLTVVQKSKDTVAKELGITLTAVGSTTGKGFASLVAGEIDIAMGADELAGVVKAANAKGVAAKVEDYEEVYLKDSHVVFVVNHKNTVPMLSEAQLRSVLSGEVKSWKELGGPDLPVVVYFEKENSANHVMIKNQLLKDLPLSKRVTWVDNVRFVASNIADVDSAFGPTPTMYLNEQVKVISDYKLTQHLCFIIRKDASPEVRAVIAAFKAKM